MARAEELERPEPFPMVGTEPISPDAVADVDPTQIGDAVVVTAADVEAVTATVAADAAADAGPGGEGEVVTSRSSGDAGPGLRSVLVLLGLAEPQRRTPRGEPAAPPRSPCPISLTPRDRGEAVADANGWVLVENELRQSGTVEGQVILQNPLPGGA